MWSIFSRDPSKDFGYELGEIVTNFDGQSVWTLVKGSKKVSFQKNYRWLIIVFVSSIDWLIDFSLFRARMTLFQYLNLKSIPTPVDDRSI